MKKRKKDFAMRFSGFLESRNTKQQQLFDV